MTKVIYSDSNTKYIDTTQFQKPDIVELPVSIFELPAFFSDILAI
jgi:hypothetical protein